VEDGVVVVGFKSKVITPFHNNECRNTKLEALATLTRKNEPRNEHQQTCSAPFATERRKASQWRPLPLQEGT